MLRDGCLPRILPNYIKQSGRKPQHTDSFSQFSMTLQSRSDELVEHVMKNIHPQKEVGIKLGQEASRPAPILGLTVEQGAQTAMAEQRNRAIMVDLGIRATIAGPPLRLCSRPLRLEPYYPRKKKILGGSIGSIGHLRALWRRGHWRALSNGQHWRYMHGIALSRGWHWMALLRSGL